MASDCLEDVVPEPLQCCTDPLLLRFDDGAALPACRGFMMMQSPVLYTIPTSVKLEKSPDGLFIIPMPGESAATWRLALSLLLPPTVSGRGAPRRAPLGGGRCVCDAWETMRASSDHSASWQ
jgi:hypothetical protein